MKPGMATRPITLSWSSTGEMAARAACLRISNWKPAIEDIQSQPIYRGLNPDYRWATAFRRPYLGREYSQTRTNSEGGTAAPAFAVPINSPSVFPFFGLHALAAHKHHTADTPSTVRNHDGEEKSG